MYTIRKINRTLRRGERIIIRGFRYSDDMHAFLNKGDNAMQWTTTADGPMEYRNLKPGTYARAGGQLHNVRHLDPAILAHI